MDRNIRLDVSYNIKETSLSARRAWIEIHLIPSNGTLRNVALRKESVDRNKKNRPSVGSSAAVALRKESVDRNTDGTVSGSGDYGRSPQGERG